MTTHETNLFVFVLQVIGAILIVCYLLFKCWKRITRKPPRAAFVAPVVVTSVTHTAPGGNPVSQIPPPGGVPANVYAAPYPAGQPNMTAIHVPPQPQMGFQPPYPQYPPMGVQPTAAQMNPPSYESAVSSVGPGAANNYPYEKQAPYNPNY